MYPKPDRILPALYGGIVMTVLVVVPGLNLINCLCCAGILLGGFGAVFFYKNEFTPDTPPYTAGDCMAVGAIAGLAGAVISTIVSSIMVLLFGNFMLEFAMQWIDQQGIQLPGEIQNVLNQALDEGVTIISILGDLLLALMIYPIFGMLGGLIGYAVYKPRPTMMPPPPPAPSGQQSV